MTIVQKLLRVFTTLIGWFGLILACVIAQPLLERLGLFTDLVAIGWAVALVVWISLGSLGVFWYLWQVLIDPAHRQARTRGLAAQARVLEVRATGARVRRRKRIVALEHVIRVAVMPPVSAEYEANVVMFLKPALVPRQNAIITVSVHPHRPEIVVWEPTE